MMRKSSGDFSVLRLLFFFFFFSEKTLRENFWGLEFFLKTVLCVYHMYNGDKNTHTTTITD
jgi:hypothetical protein